MIKLWFLLKKYLEVIAHDSFASFLWLLYHVQMRQKFRLRRIIIILKGIVIRIFAFRVIIFAMCGFRKLEHFIILIYILAFIEFEGEVILVFDKWLIIVRNYYWRVFVSDESRRFLCVAISKRREI